MILYFLLMLLPSLAEGAPAAPWIEVKLPGEFFTIVTDAGERAGTKVTFRLAQFDRVLQMRFAWIRIPAATDPPLLVFASADEAVVRSLAPEAIDVDTSFSSDRRPPELSARASRRRHLRVS